MVKNMLNNTKKPEVQKLIPDILVFVIGGLLQFFVVYLCVPTLSGIGIMPLGSWMILSIPLIFLPVIAGGLIILRLEKGTEKITKRLLFHKLNKNDWLWFLTGLIIMAAGSAIMFKLCAVLGLDSNPPFARNAKAWTEGHLWMFALWAVYWPFNILGENIVWRGVILPRMERKVGKFAWLLNAFFWGVFHLAFGIGNLIILLPTLIVVPFIAQRTHNTWTAVMLHASLSGPGFIALAFGMMG